MKTSLQLLIVQLTVLLVVASFGQGCVQPRFYIDDQKPNPWDVVQMLRQENLRLEERHSRLYSLPTADFISVSMNDTDPFPQTYLWEWARYPILIRDDELYQDARVAFNELLDAMAAKTASDNSDDWRADDDFVKKIDQAAESMAQFEWYVDVRSRPQLTASDPFDIEQSVRSDLYPVSTAIAANDFRREVHNRDFGFVHLRWRSLPAALGAQRSLNHEQRCRLRTDLLNLKIVPPSRNGAKHNGPVAPEQTPAATPPAPIASPPQTCPSTPNTKPSTPDTKPSTML